MRTSRFILSVFCLTLLGAVASAQSNSLETVVTNEISFQDTELNHTATGPIVLEEDLTAKNWIVNFWRRFCLPVSLFYGTVGIFLCFFGFRFFRQTFGFLGFTIGVAAAYTVMCSHYSGDTGARFLGTTIGIGLLFGLVLAYAYTIGIFLFGFQVGALLGALVSLVPLAFLGDSFKFIMYLIAIPLGLYGGMLALHHRKPLIIILTAINGAGFICMAALWAGMTFFTFRDLAFSTPWQMLTHTYLMFYLFTPATLVLGIVGGIYQFRSTRTRSIPGHRQ